jgi:tetratricopeptide (TPR) repeat protein
MKIRTFLTCSVLALGLAACAVPRGAPSAPAKPGREAFELHLRQGLALLAQKEYGKAEAELQAAGSIDPGSVKAHNYLGICYFQQEAFEPALVEFQKATELDPSFATAYNNLGGVYSMRHQFDKAEAMYKRALALAPDLVAANYSLGMLLSNLGRREEGYVYLSRGIALDPDHLEKNHDFLSTFTSTSFDMKEAYFAFARAFAMTGDVDKTASYLEKARAAGFVDWRRILTDKEFEKVRDDPKIKKFLI